MNNNKFLKPKKRLLLKAEFGEIGLLTNQEIADALGLKKSTIDHVLSGWKFPGQMVQGRIMEKLGISTDRLARLL